MAHGSKSPAPAPPAHADNSAEAVAARLKANLLHEKKELEVDKIFRALVKLEGSDLHLKVGQPPIVRVGGELKSLNRGPIDMEEMVNLLIPMMDQRNLLIFEEEGGADFSHTCDVDGTRWRFRVNMLKSLGNIGLGCTSNQQLDPRFSKVCFCRTPSKPFATSSKAWCCWLGLPVPEKVRRLVRCSITSTRFIENTS